jgi:hypothetical protein
VAVMVQDPVGLDRTQESDAVIPLRPGHQGGQLRTVPGHGQPAREAVMHEPESVNQGVEVLAGNRTTNR